MSDFFTLMSRAARASNFSRGVRVSSSAESLSAMYQRISLVAKNSKHQYCLICRLPAGVYENLPIHSGCLQSLASIVAASGASVLYGIESLRNRARNQSKGTQASFASSIVGTGAQTERVNDRVKISRHHEQLLRGKISNMLSAASSSAISSSEQRIYRHRQFPFCPSRTRPKLPPNAAKGYSLSQLLGHQHLAQAPKSPKRLPKYKNVSPK